MNTNQTEFKRPAVLILGGHKVAEQISLMQKYLPDVDTILLGGAVANTFLAAQGYDIGKSAYSDDKIPDAQEIMESAEVLQKKIILPVDAVVADKDEEKAPTIETPIEDIELEMKILDIGGKTLITYQDIIKSAKTVIWGGQLSSSTTKQFQHSTESLLNTASGVPSCKLIRID